MTTECTYGNHTWVAEIDGAWQTCSSCGVSNNFKSKPGSVAKEINGLRERLDREAKEADRLMGVADDYWKRIKELEKKLEEYEKSPVEAFTSSPFVGTKGLGEIIDLLATYYPIPVAGQHYAAHLKYEFAQLRKQRKDAEAADELESKRADEWKAEGACDACGGMGGIIDCMCEGSGRAKDAVIYLRKEGWRLQALARDQAENNKNDKDALHQENVRWREVAATTNASNPDTLDACIRLLKGNFDRGYAWGLNKRTDEIALLRRWVSCHYMHSDFGPCMKCGCPSLDDLPHMGNFEGYEAKYDGDCGFCGVCEACKAGRT